MDNQASGPWRRAALVTIGVGLAYAVLFVAAYLLAASGPRATASNADIVAFYANPHSRRLVLAGLYLMPFAGIAFVWFIIALRMWISAHGSLENALLSNVQLVSGILFVGLFFSAAAAFSATAAAVELSEAPVDPAVARQLPVYGNALLFVFGLRMAAMFVFTTTTTIGRNAGILPRWFIYLGYAVGVFLLLTATFNVALVLVLPVWVAILCALLYRRVRRSIAPTDRVA